MIHRLQCLDLATEVFMTLRDNLNLSDAVALYLKRYPGQNDDEFNARYGSESEAIEAEVKQLLREATQIELDWDRLSLNEAGDYVESVIHERHPELTAAALEAIGNYFTFTMR